MRANHLSMEIRYADHYWCTHEYRRHTDTIHCMLYADACGIGIECGALIDFDARLFGADLAAHADLVRPVK